MTSFQPTAALAGPPTGGALPFCETGSLELVRAAKGDRGRRAELIAAYRPRIATMARAYRRPGTIERDELMQQGVVGLLRALERYDPLLGTPFWAYASWWVRQAMQQLVAELSGPIVLSDRALREMARLRVARLAYVQEHRREPTRKELAAATDVDEEHVDRLAAATGRARGLDEPLGDGEGRARLGDMLPDPQGEDELEWIPNRTAAAEVPALLAQLDARQRFVICSHFGVGGAQRTLREIATDLGLTPERARQIEHQALESLRAMVIAGDDEPRRPAARTAGARRRTVRKHGGCDRVLAKGPVRRDEAGAV